MDCLKPAVNLNKLIKCHVTKDFKTIVVHFPIFYAYFNVNLDSNVWWFQNHSTEISYSICDSAKMQGLICEGK